MAPVEGTSYAPVADSLSLSFSLSPSPSIYAYASTHGIKLILPPSTHIAEIALFCTPAVPGSRFFKRMLCRFSLAMRASKEQAPKQNEIEMRIEYIPRSCHVTFTSTNDNNTNALVISQSVILIH